MALEIVLASASPRRKELLAKISSQFEILVAEVAEIEPPHCHWSETALFNAKAKALAVAERRPAKLSLGADTVIELDGRILGKPDSPAEAKAMLRAMAGRVHNVATGVCLAAKQKGLLCQFVELTEVRFKRLSDATIDEYLAKTHVLDKAGAYAIQENGELIIEGIDGDLDNVVGLPVARIKEALLALHAL